MCFFFQAEDGIRDLVRSRGLGDVYKRQQESRLTDTGSSEDQNGLARFDDVLNDVNRAVHSLSLIHI